MDEISNIKFNLTPLMTNKIVEINKLKMELQKLDEMIVDEKNSELLVKKEKIQEEIDIAKKIFIKEFQHNNKDQISKYLELKEKD